MRSQLIAQPSIEPVSLDKAKLYCKVSHDVEDDLIRGMIKSARSTAETYARISIAPQKYRFEARTPRIIGFGLDIHYPMDAGYSGGFEGRSEAGLGSSLDRVNDPDRIYEGVQFPKGPLVSVDAVFATAINGDRAPVDPALYSVFAGTLLWRERRWMLATNVRGVSFEVTCGFPVQPVADGETPTELDLPADIEEAILVMVADRYENRGQNQTVIPALAKQLLSRYWTSPTYRS